MHLPQHRRKHRGGRGGFKHHLRSQAHTSSLPSILLANVKALDNKLDRFRTRISFQRDIRNCNVLCFTETWLNPGILDSIIQPGEDIVFLVMDINLPDTVDWVKMRSNQRFFTITQLVGTCRQAENFAYRLELIRRLFIA